MNEKRNPFSIYEQVHRNSCATAALVSVYSDFGIRVSEMDIRSQLGVGIDKGLCWYQIEGHARLMGFKTEFLINVDYEVLLTDIFPGLNKKIVGWLPPESNPGWYHLSPVISANNKHITLMESKLGTVERYKKDSFIRMWKDFQYKHSVLFIYK